MHVCMHSLMATHLAGVAKLLQQDLLESLDLLLGEINLVQIDLLVCQR